MLNAKDHQKAVEEEVSAALMQNVLMIQIAKMKIIFTIASVIKGSKGTEKFVKEVFFSLARIH